MIVYFPWFILAIVVAFLFVWIAKLAVETVEQYEMDQYRNSFKNLPNFAMLFPEEAEGMSEEEIDRKLSQMINEQMKKL